MTEKDKNTVSASEINKFTYCNYQWYYEKVYGRKKLADQKRELNESLGLYDSSFSNFRRGQKFHDGYYLKYTMVRIIKIVLIILIITAITLITCFLLYKK